MVHHLVHRALHRVGIALFLGFCLTATSLQAQIPEEFKNLKVLPKEISKDELVDVMRDFSSALGVRCSFCHARKDPNPQSEFDWASDSKPEKETARGMMRMTQWINTEQIPKIAEEEHDLVEVKCATCHHGQEHPRLIEDVLSHAFQDGGFESLTQKYTELRAQYYGSATYDFSVRMLPLLIDRLGGDEKPDLGVQLARFNLDFFPDSGYAHMALGQALAASGQKEAAENELKIASELDPELEEHVRRILDRMSKQ